MMRALYSGVSGLRTHQTRMDVIGNNIANVNTTAFKAKQMNFSDMLYQTTQAATGANSANGTGGTNPRQIGLGVKAAAINTTITQEGANQSTGNPFDLKLTGEAFFVVSDGTSTFYTRDGSFDVDDDGNLCMASTGYIVQGWGVDENGDIVQGTLGGINVTAQDTFGAAATTQGKITGIIDSNDGELENKTGKQVTVNLYDKAGYQYDMKFGILPTKRVTNGTRDITNTEKGETRILSDSASPELMEDLEATIWKYVSGKLSSASVTRYGLSGAGNDSTKTYTFGGNKNTVTISLGAFIDATKYSNTTLTDSALRHVKDITVEFSGDYGYVKDPPTYPLSDNVLVSKISDDAVKYMYQQDSTTTGTCLAYASYSVKLTPTGGANSTVSVTSLQQTYVDDNGKSQTDYTFKVGNTEIKDGDNEIPSSLYNDITRLLALGKEKNITNTYTTQENKTTETVEKGSFKITLLGMTDATGASVNIDSLVNSGTTSWDVFYNTGDGEFRYVGQEGNKAFSVNLSMLGDNFDNIDIDMSGTRNGNNGNKSSVTGNKLDGRKIGTRTGVSIGTDGIVTALYSNGMSRKLGQLCVATFPNAMGLENSGDNLYQVTASSGDVNIVDIKASGTGVMTSGVLEMSNVDLSQQFTDMFPSKQPYYYHFRYTA